MSSLPHYLCGYRKCYNTNQALLASTENLNLTLPLNGKEQEAIQYLVYGKG